MKTVIDNAKIKRRAALSNAASVGGLLVLLASVALPYLRPEMAAAASILMVIGLAVSMTGIYFANRWVKRPRPEQVLDEALKGLSDSHVLFHYLRMPADHVLLTPVGLLVIETVNLEGVFSYANGRWRERMGLGRALRWIVEEHLGDPLKAAQEAASDLRRRLESENLKAPVRAVVVFTHPRAVVETAGAALPVVKAEKLKKHAQEKGVKLPADAVEAVRGYLEGLG
jgi:hypothetical protein